MLTALTVDELLRLIGGTSSSDTVCAVAWPLRLRKEGSAIRANQAKRDCRYDCINHTPNKNFKGA